MNNGYSPYNQRFVPRQVMRQSAPPKNDGNGIWNRKTILPKWLSTYSVMGYVLALAIVTLMYTSHSLQWYYMLSGVMSIVIFFFYGAHLAEKTSIVKMHRNIRFERQIFLVSFVLRVAWMALIYTIFMQNYGDAFGFESGDALYYDELGQFVAGKIERGDFHFYDEISQWSGNRDIADMGYGIYVGFVYWLTGNSIIAVRLLKCIWSAWTVLLIYRLAKRNFGEQTGRIAAIFVALWPNFWYYSGTHLKEVEMTFLAVLFVEQAEQMLRSRQFTTWKLIPILLVAAAMFTFRTILGIVALLALVFAVVMASSRVMTWGKRVIVGFLAILLIGVTAGNRIQEQASQLYEQVNSGQQKENMEWRAKRKDGNTFARYAGTAVFAPLIFTLPFPTMTLSSESQDLQQLLNGGNFIKNIMSAFTILAMFSLLLSGKWREHMLSLAFMLGYLVVLTMSAYAQSGRFHQPVVPFELMFAAYGLSVALTKAKYKRWFTYWCMLMVVAAVAWNWFKLAGRGLV